MMKILRRSIPVLLFGAGTACDSPTSTAPAPEIVSVTVDSSAGPLIRTATVSLDRPGPVALTYAAPGTPVLTMHADSNSATHVVTLPRLRAEHSYRLQTVATPDHEDADVAETTFTTGALPDDVAAITFNATGTPTLPVAFVELVAGTRMLGLVIVEDGEIVWFHRTTGSLFGTTRRTNGDVVLLDGTLGLVSRRLDGTLAHRLPQPDSAPSAQYGRIHHDVTATPRNTILFIANETRSVAAQNVTGEALWEWTPETNTVVKRWSAFDHLDWANERGPRSDPSNWLHGNGLAFGPRGNVIMSLRNIDQVISIAPDFSRVEWRLGGPGATLATPAENRILGQHGVSEPVLNRVLVFDNGFERPGTPYSRAIEFTIDVAAGTATRAWEYRPTPDVYAALVGSAKRVPNGNTVVLFGMSPGHNSSTGPLAAIEVDQNGMEKWRLAPGPAVIRLYRVTPVASLLGEEPGIFR